MALSTPPSYAPSMTRAVIVIVSAAIFIVAVSVAATRGGASYTLDEVRTAFEQQQYTLVSPPVDESNPFAPYAGSTFLFPEPYRKAPFYVLVARNDQLAQEFFAPLAAAGGGQRVFDALHGNVVVSSDASLTEVGLTAGERRRIRAALALLGDG